MLSRLQATAWGAALGAPAVSAASCWKAGEERFTSLTEYDVHRPPLLGAARPGAAEVLVLVMASRGLEERVRLVEEAWAKIAVERRYVVDDWLDSVPRHRQWLPPSRAKTGVTPESSGPVSEGYWDAQTRQLEFMQAHPKLATGAEGFKWVILADDDTYVSVENLLGFVQGRDHLDPVLFGYILSDAHVLGYDYPCGGAGMLLSAGAYELIAPRLLTRDCPLMSFNDLTLGFCAHSFGVTVVHNHNMRCSPDLNRAMRSGENFLDLQRGISVHRLPGFQRFTDIISTISQMEGQKAALVDKDCRLVARVSEDALDSRRFYWTSGAFVDLVAACRGGDRRPWAAKDEPLHLDFIMFGRGTPVARYHKDRTAPNIASPQERAARWPDWMEQLRHLDCAGHGDTWNAQWLDAAPRISRGSLEASNLTDVAQSTDVTEAELEASFAKLEESSPRGSWAEEALRAVRSRRSSMPPGRRWLFLDFSPATTFVNIFESLATLRALSALHRDGGFGEAGAFYGERVYEPVDLSAGEPPPLALAYEYFDLNIEQDAGVWLNGVAVRRLLRCPPKDHSIQLNWEGHANDWETEAARLKLLWHNALAVDIMRTLRFCGVMVLHTPQMVPHALSYLPYSTNRRVHASSASAAMTVGNVMSREQLYTLSELVQRRACRAKARARGKTPAFSSPLNCSTEEPAPRSKRWQPCLRVRALGGCAAEELSERQWQLPGARFLGQAMVAFRSEHFLPDAQAA